MSALGLLVLGSRPPPEKIFYGTVKDLLPTIDGLSGWTVEYHPIADTPEMKAKVTELLNYDDAVFAVYRKGTARLSVYIAYWAPGKMSHRLVAGHTPDVCWVGGGWKILEAKSKVVLTNGQSGRVLPAEKRAMAINGRIEHVVFWHLLDGEVKSYDTQGTAPWYAMFSDLLIRKFNQQPEQYFIRISSNVPVEAWPSMEVYRRLMGGLPLANTP